MKNLIFAIRPLASDLLSTIVFVAVSSVTHSPVAATVLALAAGVAQVARLVLRREQVTSMQWASLGLVVVFGAATLITHNPRFMMLKPSIIYVVVGAAMLKRGWMLSYLPPAAQGRIPDGVMVGWGYAWAGLMFATAILNLGFALLASFVVWSAFIAAFPLVSKLALFALNFAMIRAAVRRRIREGEVVLSAPEAVAV